MKRIGIIIFVTSFLILSCEGEKREKYKIKKHTFGKYPYITVTNDPTKTRIYTLKNGLKVYLSVYKDAPRIQTYIAIKAGSKNDPPYATGLAHYLEHILFKGTSKIGTTNWEKEKVLLDTIENLYEKYRKTVDVDKRKVIYQKIDSISNLAATYAIANEYDKIMSTIGAQGTNAYTFFEQTVYTNDIPSNQIENWAKTEAERFSEVVPRLFHTELEAVYEEKNKGLDNDRRKVWETLMAGLFKKHTYGTQTTIGTVEHLKNPSISEIKKFFYTYYVPNNMAICLSGDLDPDQTIEILDKYFGKMKPKEVPHFKSPVEDSIKNPEIFDVYGPDAENVTIGFRLPNGTSKEAIIGEFLSTMLSNGQAGLIDINLNQKQKILGGYSYFLRLKDYSVHILGGSPRSGQTLEQVKDLLLAQIDSIKQGKFEEWLISAIRNNNKVAKMKALESNQDRADAFVTSFVLDQSWKAYLEEEDILAALTKKDIIDFATKFYAENYVLVNKKVGKDTSIQKVPKPPITPVTVDRKSKSDFFKCIENSKIKPIEPVFIDFSKELDFYKTNKGIEIVYKKNEENGLFNVSYVLDMGYLNNPKLSLAISYLDYIGTKKYSAEQFQKEFYKLACQYHVSCTEDKTTISISGLSSNMEKALFLIEELINDPAPDNKAYQDLVAGILKVRMNNKLNKNIILKKAMFNYAKYGSKNPFNTVLSEQELKETKPEELTTIIKSLFNYSHRVLYYGPYTKNKLAYVIDNFHQQRNQRLEFLPSKKFEEREIKTNEIYFTQYDMVQAEVMFLSSSIKYDKNLIPIIELFNQYFGGDMSSIVFQEIRESRALAYAVRSQYTTAVEKDKRNYLISYIGTQADKLPEALEAMEDLLEKLPYSEQNLVTAKEAIIKSIESDRITKASLLDAYEAAKKLGITYDIRKDIYNSIEKLTFQDLEKFYAKFIKGKPKAILVLGDKNKLPINFLQNKYGTVNELSLDELFGY